MSLKTKLFKLIAELDEREKAQLKAMLNGEETGGQEETLSVTPQEALQGAEKKDGKIPEEQSTAAEQTPASGILPSIDGEAPESTPPETEESPPETEAETPPEIAEESAAEGDEIPPMTVLPTEEISPEESPAATSQTDEPQEISGQEAPLADEQGEEMPVDYQQIIDGLNAKNMALEAENKQLKAKVEGAFGLTGKPSGFAKVNPLYDDAGDVPPMRKNY